MVQGSWSRCVIYGWKMDGNGRREFFIVPDLVDCCRKGHYRFLCVGWSRSIFMREGTLNGNPSKKGMKII